MAPKRARSPSPSALAPRGANLSLFQPPVALDAVVAAALAYAASIYGRHALDSFFGAWSCTGPLTFAEGLWLSAGLSYGFQVVNFLLSRFAIADNFTGLIEFLPAPLIMYSRLGPEAPNPRQTLLTCMIAAWSLRLGLFLLYRMFARSGPDARMDDLRAYPGVLKVQLLSFWLIHGTWGFVVSLPVTLGENVNTCPCHARLTPPHIHSRNAGLSG